MTRTFTRALTVLAAPATAVTAWALLRLSGIALVTDTGSTVGPVSVIVVATLAALAGWAVIAVIERRTRRPALWWGLIGSATLALSILGPGQTAQGADLLGLILLHLVVAAVVMGGLGASLGRPARTCGRRCGENDPHRLHAFYA